MISRRLRTTHTHSYQRQELFRFRRALNIAFILPVISAIKFYGPIGNFNKIYVCATSPLTIWKFYGILKLKDQGFLEEHENSILIQHNKY